MKAFFFRGGGGGGGGGGEGVSKKNGERVRKNSKINKRGMGVY